MTTLGPQEDLPGHERMAPSTFFFKKKTQPPRDFKPNSCVYFGERKKKLVSPVSQRHPKPFFLLLLGEIRKCLSISRPVAGNCPYITHTNAQWPGKTCQVLSTCL